MELVQQFRGERYGTDQGEIVRELHQKQDELGQAIIRLKRYNGLE